MIETLAIKNNLTKIPVTAKNKYKLKNILLSSRIKAKWLNDKRQLPLTPAHYELYDLIHRRYCWLPSEVRVVELNLNTSMLSI